MLKLKICTIITIILDILAMILVFKLAIESLSLILWFILFLISAIFLWDIKQAITFYYKIK